MQLFVRRDGFLELLLADVAPGTDGVAHDFDVEFSHFVEGRFEHIRERRRIEDLEA